MEIGRVSFGEFARLVQTSEPTLRKRLPEAPDGVVLARGKNGEAYEIDPHVGAAWWKGLAADAEAARQARAAALAELQLDLLGDVPALDAHDLAGLTPAEQAAQLDAELKAINLGRLRGEYVRAADVEAAAAAWMLAVADKANTLVDRLRKRAEITPETAAALADLVHADLDDLGAAAAKDKPLGKTEGAAAGCAV